MLLSAIYSVSLPHPIYLSFILVSSTPCDFCALPINNRYIATRKLGSDMVESSLPHTPFRSPFFMLPYDVITFHLVSRHPHKIGFKGYTASLTSSSWFYFIAITFTIAFITQILSYITFEKWHGWTNVAIYCGLFHRVQLGIYKHLKGHRAAQCLQFLLTIQYFFFLLFYNQDLRANTIEPYYEVLPKKFLEVDLKTQQVYFDEGVPFTFKYNMHTVFGKGQNYKPQLNSYHELKHMSLNNTFFVQTSKQVAVLINLQLNTLNYKLICRITMKTIIICFLIWLRMKSQIIQVYLTMMDHMNGNGECLLM